MERFSDITPKKTSKETSPKKSHRPFGFPSEQNPEAHSEEETESPHLRGHETEASHLRSGDEDSTQQDFLKEIKSRKRLKRTFICLKNDWVLPLVGGMIFKSISDRVYNNFYPNDSFNMKDMQKLLDPLHNQLRSMDGELRSLRNELPKDITNSFDSQFQYKTGHDEIPPMPVFDWTQQRHIEVPPPTVHDIERLMKQKKFPELFLTACKQQEIFATVKDKRLINSIRPMFMDENLMESIYDMCQKPEVKEALGKSTMNMQQPMDSLRPLFDDPFFRHNFTNISEKYKQKRAASDNLHTMIQKPFDEIQESLKNIQKSLAELSTSDKRDRASNHHSDTTDQYNDIQKSLKNIQKSLTEFPTSDKRDQVSNHHSDTTAQYNEMQKSINDIQKSLATNPASDKHDKTSSDHLLSISQYNEMQKSLYDMKKTLMEISVKNNYDSASQKKPLDKATEKAIESHFSLSDQVYGVLGWSAGASAILAGYVAISHIYGLFKVRKTLRKVQKEVKDSNTAINDIRATNRTAINDIQATNNTAINAIKENNSKALDDFKEKSLGIKQDTKKTLNWIERLNPFFQRIEASFQQVDQNFQQTVKDKLEELIRRDEENKFYLHRIWDVLNYAASGRHPSNPPRDTQKNPPPAADTSHSLPSSSNKRRLTERKEKEVD